MTRKPQAPEDTEREILEAAQTLLRERPFREVTVNAIMARTGVKRPSFYVHFRDRHDVVLRVFAEIGDEMYAVTEPWFAADADAIEANRVGLGGLVGLYARHGRVIKAVADAAADDPDVDAAYHAMAQRFIDATAHRIRAEQQVRRTQVVDADEVARALVWMNERYLSEMFGGEPLVEPALATDVLHRIWIAAIYAPTRD